MRLQWMRRIASWGAVGSAIIYLGVGFGFIDAGTGGMDLLGPFLGIGLGLIVLSVAVMDLRRRGWFAAFGLAEIGLIGAYVATLAQRTPAVEVWGLALQAIQVAMVVALARLALARPPTRDTSRPPRDVLTWKASSA